ncbi:MAG TPA: histidine phosphatase family protein [Acidimicrobiales bacterium]|nr:histidine phosphatase family protein [Acidimicrobiales bacterium]
MPAADLLVLAKHARPDVDPTLPAAEWTIGIDGMEGSHRLAQRVAPIGIDLVVSSVEPKAVETARIVATDLDLPYQTGHDLHEHSRRSTGYLDAVRFEAAIRRLFAEPSSLVFGDETADAAAARFGAGVRAIHRAQPGKRLCIVAHGTVVALHLERSYGVDGWSTWKALSGLPSYVVVDRRSRAVVDVVRSV